MSKLKQAIDPSKNIAVFASAGTGKTHLLIHRILKLLLSDVAPANILAITFTRKAASEMQERLMKVLEDWAGFSDKELIIALKDLAHTCDKLSIAKARNLYETILFSDYDIRISTFHAFCQDILKRFAIHANVPTGFHLIESTENIKQEARESLFRKAQHPDEAHLSDNIHLLLRHCSTVNNLNAALDTFIDSQNDWRSFVEGQSDAVNYASENIRRSLFNKQEIIEHGEFYITLRKDLLQYQSYLLLHDNDTNKKNHALISKFLNLEPYSDKNIEIITSVFFTKEEKPKYKKPNKTLEKKLGTRNYDDFMVLHERLVALISEQLDLMKKKNLFQLNQAWFYVGNKLLGEYQKLKFNRNILDFDDLEWHTYELLNKHENASWIQYKLDQRIEHILIDEFQDTNPTQWNLLLPLLEELAASLDENSNKSLFFVGDTKQSIYSFRRANPQLQATASTWAKEKLQAQLLETDLSYRSSPVIVNFVNSIFDNLAEPLIENYTTHQANFTDMWGHVEIFPLIAKEITDNEPKKSTESLNTFRDPLLESRGRTELDTHYHEGQMVAKNIKQLIAKPIAIHTSEGTRAARYSDVIILTRNRNHLFSFELALREHGINYRSVSEGDFLSQLEVQDMLSLLTYLIQPHNDLALAQTLRSPCFAASDEDLMQLSSYMRNQIDDSKNISWHEKLNKYSDAHPDSLLAKANSLLQEFSLLANKIPVHDLLDKIFFKLNIYKRYTNSCPSNKREQVHTNLTHLLQLTLDVDAGRYSSIQSFLESIQETKIDGPSIDTKSQSAPQEDAVQIMTTHGAKGLEAPIVFLIDTATVPSQQRAYNTMINWPSRSNKPKEFFIFGRKKDIDLKTQSKLDASSQKNWNEELNLLYVALTRAKQYLFISGVEPAKGHSKSWFSVINSALQKAGKNLKDGSVKISYGKSPTIIAPTTSDRESVELKSEYNLHEPFKSKDKTSDINSISDEQADYGTLVHKIFELIDEQSISDIEILKLHVENSIARNISTNEFNSAIKEVENCIQTNDLSMLFNKTNKHKILNEVPICINQSNNVITRIIDRLILTDNEAWIVDFKTTQQATNKNLAQVATQYKKQISEYIYAVKKLYPEKKIRASILFTTIATLYDYKVDELI